uniref:DUF7027 domain-containing protein n=1 Tax=Plectus sambesii TaxID=2011161 RepID=A0A914WNL3_9BILA
MSQVQPQFDPDHSKYFCCCGCHVTVGAKILASLQTASIILIALGVIPMIQQVKREPHFTSILVTFICIFLIIALINGSLWYGLITEREGFLMPILICLAISLVLLGANTVRLLVIVIITMIKFATHKYEILLTSVYIYILLFFLQYLFFFLQYMIFLVFKNAYAYIKDKRFYLIGDSVNMQQSRHVYIAVPKENSEP